MATVEKMPVFFEEVGDFLASAPSREELLAFRPSEAVQDRYRNLLDRSGQRRLTREEQYEFAQFEQIEMLLQYVKAQIHAKKKRS